MLYYMDYDMYGLRYVISTVPSRFVILVSVVPSGNFITVKEMRVTVSLGDYQSR